MKRTVLLTSMLFLCLAASADEIKAKSSSVHVVSSRMDVFYFKIDKEFIGAELEIYSQDGQKLMNQKLDHRKVLIDFYFENPGNYIILFKKNGTQEEFKFTKQDECLESEKPANLISVMQGVWGNLK